jgi:opacity protein-like surface antigen
MQNKPFNRFIFTTGAAFVATLLALAASTARAGLFDIPSEPADWNGPFVSFNSGVVINNFHQGSYFDTVDLTKQFNTGSGDSDGPPDFFDFFGFSGHDSTDTAYSGGIDLGYNKQWGHFVIGLGFGFSGTHTSDKSRGFGFDEGFDDVPDDAGFLTETTSIRKLTENWSGYAGGLVGFAWNRFLFYAIGGSAFAQLDLATYDVSNTEFFPDGGTVPSIITPRQPTSFFTHAKSVDALNNILTGWYAGGGVQFAFSNVLTAGLEFRHNDYGDRRYHPDGHDGVFPEGVNVGLDDNQVLFKVGILLGHLGEKGAPAPAPKN